MTTRLLSLVAACAALACGERTFQAHDDLATTDPAATDLVEGAFDDRRARFRPRDGSVPTALDESKRCTFATGNGTGLRAVNTEQQPLGIARSETSADFYVLFMFGDPAPTFCGNPVPSEPDVGLQFGIARMSPDLDVRWVNRVPLKSSEPPQGMTVLMVDRIAAAPDDTLYVTGFFKGNLVTPAATLEGIPPEPYCCWTGFVARLDASGGFLWARTFGADRVQVSDLAVTSSGVVLSGTVLGSSTTFGYSAPNAKGRSFLLPVDADASFGAARIFDDGEDCAAGAVAVTSTGDFVIATYCWSYDKRGTFVARVGPDGSVRWKSSMSAPIFGFAHIAVSADDSVFATYHGESMTFGPDQIVRDAHGGGSAMLLAFTPDGEPAWGRYLHRFFNGHVCLNEQDHLSLAGGGATLRFQGADLPGDLATLRVSTSGALQQALGLEDAPHPDSTEWAGSDVRGFTCGRDGWSYGVAWSDVALEGDGVRVERSNILFAVPPVAP